MISKMKRATILLAVLGAFALITFMGKTGLAQQRMSATKTAYEAKCYHIWNLSKLKQCVANAARAVGGAVSKAATWVAAATKQGVNYVKSQFRMLWSGIKSLDCGTVITAFSGLDPLTWILGRISSKARTCLTEIRKGFFCAIPDFIKDVGTMIWGVAKATWANKSRCFRAALATPMMPTLGAFACGFYYWAKNKVGKIYNCIRSIGGNKVLAILKQEAFKLGCSFIGGLILDAVLAAVSGGSTLAASIAKWIAKIQKYISPNTWLRISNKIGSHVVNNLYGYTVNSMKRFSACK